MSNLELLAARGRRPGRDWSKRGPWPCHPACLRPGCQYRGKPVTRAANAQDAHSLHVAPHPPGIGTLAAPLNHIALRGFDLPWGAKASPVPSAPW